MINHIQVIFLFTFKKKKKLIAALDGFINLSNNNGDFLLLTLGISMKMKFQSILPYRGDN
jgi:hypothetical protein